MQQDRNFDQILSHANDRIGASITLVLVWLVISDGHISADEIEYLNRIAEPIQLKDYVKKMVELVDDDQSEALLTACRILQKSLTEEQRDRLLELVLGMALVDGYFTASEGHIVRFLADLLGFSPHRLDQEFKHITGHSLPSVGDPSSIEWWHARERTRNGESEKQQSRNQRSRRRTDVEQRAWALSVLGLSEEATPEQIKQAYRRLAQLHHPDKFARLGPEAVEAANTIFKKINEAYEVLAVT